MKESRQIAICGMMAALSIVILVVGAVLGIGMYAAPMLAGLMLIPIGHKLGRKYHIMIWAVVSILSFMLISNIEQNLMYLCLFGCYPIIRPWFERRRKGLRLALKLIYFNAVAISLEALIMLVLVPESMSAVLTVIFLALANLTFVCYDFIIPRAELLISKYLGRFISKIK